MDSGDIPKGFFGVLFTNENTLGINSDHPTFESGPSAHPKMRAFKWFMIIAFWRSQMLFAWGWYGIQEAVSVPRTSFKRLISKPAKAPSLSDLSLAEGPYLACSSSHSGVNVYRISCWALLIMNANCTTSTEQIVLWVMRLDSCGKHAAC